MRKRFYQWMQALMVVLISIGGTVLPLSNLTALAATSLSISTSSISDAVVGQPFSQTLTASETSGVTWSILPMPEINAVFHDSGSTQTWDSNSSSNYSIPTVMGSVYNQQAIVTGNQVTFVYQGSLASTSSSITMNYVFNNDWSNTQHLAMTKQGADWMGTITIPTTEAGNPTNLVTMYFNNNQNSYDSNSLGGGKNYQFTVGTSAALTPGAWGTIGYAGSLLTTKNPPVVMHWGIDGWANGYVYETSMVSQPSGDVASFRVPGALPPGLQLSANGTISGMPTAAGNYTLQVQATDGVNTATYWYTMHVLGQTLAPATAGAPYSTNGALLTDGTTTSPTWQSVTGSVYGGPLPTGLTLSSAGDLSGTPTTAGNYYFTAQATDVTGAVYDELEQLTVNPAPAITTSATSLTAPLSGQAYHAQITMTGGTAPFTWSIAKGQLPTGIQLSSTGLLSGTTNQPGSYTFTVQAKDSLGAVASQTYTWQVTGQTITVDTTTVQAGYGATTLHVTGKQTTFASGKTNVFLTNTVNGTVYLPPSSVTVTSPTMLSIALPTGNAGIGAGQYTLNTVTNGQVQTTPFMVTPYTTTANLQWDGLYTSQSAPYLSTSSPTPGSSFTIGFRAYSGNVVSASLNIYDTKTSQNTIIPMKPGKTWGPYQLWTATATASNGGMNWYRIDIHDATGKTIACFSGDGLHASDTNNNNFPVPFSPFSFNTFSAMQGTSVTATGGNVDFGAGKVIVSFVDQNGNVVDTTTGVNGAWSNVSFTVPQSLPSGLYTVQVDDQNSDSNGVVNTDVVRSATLVVGTGNYWFNSLYHDSTNSFYRSPFGAVQAGTPITLRLRSIAGSSNATLFYQPLNSSTPISVPMTPVTMSNAQITAATGDTNPSAYSYWQATIPSSASQGASVVATVAGSFQTAVGSSSNWDPGSQKTTMTEVNPNLYQLTVTIPAGSYQYKVALNHGWSVSYPGANINLTVPSGGAKVTFSYVPSVNGVYDSINNPNPTFPTQITGGLMWYQFSVTYQGQTIYYTDNGSQQAGVGQPSFTAGGPSYQISVYDPTYQTPTWLKHAVIYEIFPDRFFNGNIANDENPNTQQGVYVNANGTENLGPIQFHKDWYSLPFDPATGSNPAYAGNGQYNIDYFGGDLQGIQDKLDYLQSLGVNTLYLTPIFQSESVHKYDTGNFMQVDPGFGTMQDYLNLVKDAKAKGMHIILDTAFEDTGSNSTYFNRFGAYGSTNGAYQNGQVNTNSPYYSWYQWAPGQTPPYNSWFGYDTLPLTNTNNPSYQNFVDNTVGPYWITQGASGWRLDSADNSNFSVPWWSAFRQAVKKVDPNAAIIGEVWNNASNDGGATPAGTDWLTGSTFDSVMNYQFRNAVLDFFAGNYNDGNEQHNAVNAAGFNRELMTLYSDYPLQSFYAMMNLVDSHDTMRILSVLEGVPSPTTMTALQQATYQPTAAQQQLGIAKLQLVSDFQFGFPGDPTVYYGDEAGATGYKDPLDRGTYPWGFANQDLLNHYRLLGAIRNANPVLQTGTFTPLYTSGSVYAFARTITGGQDVFGASAQNASAIVAINNSATATTVTIPVKGTIADGTQLLDELSNTWYTVQNGAVSMNLSAYQGAILVTPQGPVAAMQNNATATATTLSWTPVANARGYAVYEVSANGDSKRVSPRLPASVLTFDVTKLRKQNPVTLVVRASTDQGTLLSNTAVIPAKNLAMGTVSLTNSPQGNRLTWDRVKGASSYTVYQQQADSSFKPIATVTATDHEGKYLSYTDASGTLTSVYKVAAVNTDSYAVSQAAYSLPPAKQVASALISVEGGNVSFASRHGNQVSLSIPANAFLTPVKVSLYKGKSSSLRPYVAKGQKGIIYFGVQLSGQGTSSSPMTLTITNRHIQVGDVVEQGRADGTFVTVPENVSQGNMSFTLTGSSNYMLVKPTHSDKKRKNHPKHHE